MENGVKYMLDFKSPIQGLLRLHSRYGPPDRSAAHRRPLSRGSNPPGRPHEPLVSYRINRQLSGWILPPLMIRTFGAHCHEETFQQVHLIASRLHLASVFRGDWNTANIDVSSGSI